MKQQPTQLAGAVRSSNDSSNEPISTEVVAAVADAKDVDPMDLDERLFDVVDPDALDSLFEPGPFGAERAHGQITFTMSGCEVVVEASGDVSTTLVDGA